MLEIAVSERYAAEANGISARTFRDWMQRGENGEKPYDAFFAAVTRARAKAVPNMHIRALQGGKGSHQALWFLERRFREDYGQVQKIVLADEDELSDDERAAQIAAFRETVVGRSLSDGPDGLDSQGALPAETETSAPSPGTPPAP